MKKIIIAMAAIAAAFTMASCNKEQPVSLNEKPTVSKSVITASIENDLTKTTLEGNDTDGYKVFWSEGDQLFVADAFIQCWAAKYTLDNTSAGSSNGIFRWQNGDTFIPVNPSCLEPTFKNGAVYFATHPFDLVDEDNYEHLIWKTEQTYNSTERYIPMYSEMDCMEDGKADFEFKNIGGLLRLSVKGTATIKSIELRAADAISGTIDGISNWCAIIRNGTPGTCNYITLDCGDNGVQLSSEEGTDFYISMPCHFNSEGEEILDLGGYSDVTITLTDIDGKTCVKKLSSSKKLVIERSKITTASFTASEFKANTPDGALPGKFTINAAGDQVYFSQGNLYYDGSEFQFETNQYDFPNTWDATHVGYFLWNSEGDDLSACDVIFTNGTETTAKSDFTVNGISGRYRTLSRAEWEYLLYNHYCQWAEVSGVNGYVIAPDGFSGSLSDSYSDDAALAADNLVFLPAAGKYDGDFYDVGTVCVYWSSSKEGVEYANTMELERDWFDYNILFYKASCSVRLVTDVE